jgi:hypothetical protein
MSASVPDAASNRPSGENATPVSRSPGPPTQRSSVLAATACRRSARTAVDRRRALVPAPDRRPPALRADLNGTGADDGSDTHSGPAADGGGSLTVETIVIRVGWGYGRQAREDATWTSDGNRGSGSRGCDTSTGANGTHRWPSSAPAGRRWSRR